MRKILTILISIFLIPIFVLADSETLTNAHVIQLVKAGLTPETIAEKIRTSEVSFDTSTDALVELARHAVPDRLIRVMIQEQDDRGSAVMSTSAAPPTPPAPSPITPNAVTPVAPPAKAQPVVSQINKPAAPKKVGKTYRFDEVGYRRPAGGLCTVDVRVSDAGLRSIGCSKSEDFTLQWSDITAVCHRYGARGVVVFTTASTSYQIETRVPIEARDMVARVKRFIDIEPTECSAE